MGAIEEFYYKSLSKDITSLIKSVAKDSAIRAVDQYVCSQRFKDVVRENTNIELVKALLAEEQ